VLTDYSLEFFKAMRKYVFAILVLALAVAACTKETDTTSTTANTPTVGAVSDVISNYILENYPDASITSALKLSSNDTSYVITLNTSEVIAFDHNGKPFGHGGHHEWDGDSTGYPGGDTTGHHGGGHHGGGHHGGGHHGGGHNWFPADSLPLAITDYITANYAGYTIRHAELDTMCQFGGVTEVMISIDSLAPVKLVFDANNLFVASAQRILYSSIPATVTDAIAIAYPGYTARSKAEQFNLADGSIQYKVFLHLDALKVKVVFKEDGTVVCEE
jgi:hypothetical protein